MEYAGNSDDDDQDRKSPSPPVLLPPPPPPLVPMPQLIPSYSTVSIALTRLEDLIPPPALFCGSSEHMLNSDRATAWEPPTRYFRDISADRSAGPSTSGSGIAYKKYKCTADYSRSNSSSNNNSSVKHDRSRSPSPGSSGASSSVFPTPKRKLSTTKNEKAKHKQVAYPRKSPTKPSSSAATSLKTLKKYRATRNAKASPEKPRLSPIKRRVMPTRKPKTEVERNKLLFEDDDEDDESGVHSPEGDEDGDKPIIKKEVDEEEDIRRWLELNEDFGLRPVRAAAVAAAKKGQIGTNKSRHGTKKSAVFKVPKDKIPKGRSRHTIMKRSHKPNPIRKAPNDTNLEFHNSILYNGQYFQKGDIVSFYESDGTGPYYLQIRYIVTDEYYIENVNLRWLIPKSPDVVPLPFDPKNYKLCTFEPEITKCLADVHFVVHCPIEYYTSYKDEEFAQPRKGTVYIRFNQSESIMGQEEVDFPELKQFRELGINNLRQTET